MAATNLNKYLRPRLEQVAIRKVQQLRNSLDRKNVNDLGKLRASVGYKVVVNSVGDFRIDFTWKQYGDFLNEGRDDMGFLNTTGRAKLVAWVRRKIDLSEFKQREYPKSRKASNAYLAKRVAFMIQRSWSKGERYPSRRFNSKGWANVAFGSREIAESRRLILESLNTAFNKYIQDVRRAQRKKV